MPLMSATKERSLFPSILTVALITLTITYCIFGELCYFTFGKTLNKPIITDMMPSSNIIIQIVKVLFMINLVFSYPLTIYITNVVLESFTFKSFKQATATRKWLKNL